MLYSVIDTLNMGVTMFTWMMMAVALAGNPFRTEVQPVQMTQSEPSTVQVFFIVPPGHHLYQDMMKVESSSVDGLQLGTPTFPTGNLIPDPANPANWREVFDSTVKVEVPIKATKDGIFTTEWSLTYQGCKDTLCYMPKTDVVQTIVVVQAASTSTQSD